MIRAIALDDEPLALEALEVLASNYDFLSLKKFFTRPSKALKYLEEYPVDLIFLDIEMPAISGMEFAKKIDNNVMIVFTTAYDNYAAESYNLNTVDYLLKPIGGARFDQSMQKIKDIYTLNRSQILEDQYIFIRADFSTIRLEINDILYIESLADYLKVYVENGKPIVTRMTVKNMLEILPSAKFIRVHRSYIIPLKRINALKSKVIVLPEREIPIGNTYQKIVAKLR